MPKRANKTVPVLLPITTAGRACGVKYETLDKAIARGELPIRCILLKPGGAYQPLVSSRDVMVWKTRMAKRYEKFASPYHRAIVNRVETSKLPEDRVELDVARKSIYGDQGAA